MHGVDIDRRRIRTDAKRAQILEATQRLFLANGYGATSTDAIASEAGVSKQTLYAYYRSKEALLIAVLRRLIDPAAPDPFAHVMVDRCPADRAALRRALVALAQGMIAAMMQADYLALLRVIIAEAPRQPQLADLYRSTVPERGLSAIGGILARATACGVITVTNHDAAARLFVGPFLTYALLDGLFVVDGPPRPPSMEQIAEIVDLFLRAVG